MNKLQKVPEENGALALDFAKLFVKRYQGALLSPLKGTMTLYERKGHIYNMRGKFLITSDGYTILNKVASISLATPRSVIVDGKEYPNPYVERNPRTKLIESVNIRKIGIGFSPVGNVTVIDKTLSYNLYSYLIQSFQAKMKRQARGEEKGAQKKASVPCAFVGLETEKVSFEGKWVWFETLSPLGIWVNYEDEAILDCFEENIQRQRFGERIATRIVERNIFKSHPAIGVSQVDSERDPDVKGDRPLSKASVTVYGWRHEQTPEDFNEIARRAELGDENIERKVEVIEQVEEDEEKVSIEEAKQDDAEPKLFKEKKS